MRAIDAFRIIPKTDGSAGTLLFGDRPVMPLPARIVEAQFQLHDTGYVVFATQDSPFEEELTILCLDAGLGERDRLSIGRPYTPGLLEDVTPTGPTRITFRFARPEPRTLDVTPRRVLGLGRIRWLRLISK